MEVSSHEQHTNSKCTEERNIPKGNCSVENLSPRADVNSKLDFSSEFFDPREVLGVGDVALPFPNVRPYNNLSEYNSVVFNKMKRPKNINKSANDSFNSAAAQNGKNLQSGSQECDYSQELFKDKAELICNKNRYKESEDEQRNSKNRSSSGFRRKVVYSNVGSLAQRTDESEMEKHRKVPPKNLMENQKHEFEKSMNVSKQQEKQNHSFLQSGSTVHTPDLAELNKTAEGNNESTNHTTFSCSRSTETLGALRPEGPKKPAKKSNGGGKHSRNSPISKSAAENDGHQSVGRKNGPGQQEQYKRFPSKNKPNGVKLNSLELQEPAAEGGIPGKGCRDVFASDSEAIENESYYCKKQMLKNGSEQQERYRHCTSKDKNRSNVNSSELQGYSKRTSEIENFREGCSSYSSIVGPTQDSALQLSEESDETQIIQRSGAFIPGNDIRKDENYNLSDWEREKMKNVTSSRSKSCDTMELQGLVGEAIKNGRHGKTCSDNSMTESSLNNSKQREDSCYEKRKLKNSNYEEKRRFSDSSDEPLLDKPGSAEQHESKEETNRRVTEKRCSDGSASKIPATQKAYKFGHPEEGKLESCGKYHSSDIDQDSRNINRSQEPNCAELQLGKENCQEKKSTTDFHGTVKNREVVATNASEKLKHYKIPKLKNKNNDKKISEVVSAGMINESDKSIGADHSNRKKQSEVAGRTKRSADKNDLEGNVLYYRKPSYKDQERNWKKDKISQMGSEKNVNYESSWKEKSASKRASEKNIKECIEYKEKSGMNIPVERCDSGSGKKHRDDQMLPEKDNMKCHENQNYSSRHCRDFHPHRSHSQEHHNARSEENTHCHSDSEENPHDHSKNDRNCCSHSGSGNRHNHPKSDENFHDHSKYDHHRECCSRNDENRHNHSRFPESCCDHSRSDKGHNDHSRYDRRYYDRMKYDRYDRFKYRGRFSHRSKYERYGRRFRDRLQYDRYRRVQSRYDRNCYDNSRFGKNHHDDLYRDTQGHPRSYKKHKNEDETLPIHKEMKERAINDSEHCHSQYDKCHTLPETWKMQKPTDIRDQSSDNNISVDKNILKEHKRRLDYEDGEIFSDSDSNNLMDFETMPEEHDELIGKDRQMKIKQRGFEEGKNAQNHKEKLRKCGNKGDVRETEVNCEVSDHSRNYKQDHVGQRFISKRMQESCTVQYENHSKEKDEILREFRKDNIKSIHENQHDMHEDHHTESSKAENNSTKMSLKQDSRKRQANLFDFKGFTVTSKSTARDESSSTVRGTSQTTAVICRATENSDGNGTNQTCHFSRQEYSSSQQMFFESTPNTQSSHNKINFRENFWDSSCLGDMSGEGDQHKTGSGFKEVICQSSSLEPNCSQNSELLIQRSGSNSELSIEAEENLQEHFNISDSDSFVKFSDEDSHESYDGLNKKLWKNRQLPHNREIRKQRESGDASNHSLFGTSSDEDDEQNRNPEECQNNLNAELQNQHSRNSCNSDLFGSISDDDDKLEVMQFEKRNPEEKGPDEKMPTLYDRSCVKSFERTKFLENLGTEENIMQFAKRNLEGRGSSPDQKMSAPYDRSCAKSFERTKSLENLGTEKNITQFEKRSLEKRGNSPDEEMSSLYERSSAKGFERTKSLENLGTEECIIQFEKRNSEGRGNSPDREMSDPCDRSCAKSFDGTEIPENLGTEENDDRNFYNVDSDEGKSDESLKDVAEFKAIQGQNKNLAKGYEDSNGELQSQHGAEVTEPHKNCEVQVRNNSQSSVLGSAPDDEFKGCTLESLHQSKNLENSQNARQFHNLDMSGLNPDSTECTKDIVAEKQLHLNTDNRHNVERAVNDKDSEENSSIKESVASYDEKLMNHEVIYQNLKLLKQNATNDCACKCHKHCAENEKNSQRVAVICTYHDKSTQVNFDADDNYEDHVNINIVQVKITFIGDHAFAEDYKKSVLHDNMNMLLAKCHETGVRNPSLDVEGKENTESKQVKKHGRGFVSVEANKGKRKRSCADVVGKDLETKRKWKRIKNSQFLEK